MRPVRREEVLDIAAYEKARPEFRRRVMAAKEPRRVHLGPSLTLLFENALTVLYQVQEMMRAERIVGEPAIRHEIDTYNEILGGEGELGCTLLIEIPDPAERAEKLARWLGLQAKVYLGLPGGGRVWPRYDARQVGEERLSSVQYLRFSTGEQVPERAGVDFPGLECEVTLSPAARKALAEDLGLAP